MLVSSASFELINDEEKEINLSFPSLLPTAFLAIKVNYYCISRCSRPCPNFFCSCFSPQSSFYLYKPKKETVTVVLENMTARDIQTYKIITNIERKTFENLPYGEYKITVLSKNAIRVKKILLENNRNNNFIDFNLTNNYF